jgi:hypothetical protein
MYSDTGNTTSLVLGFPIRTPSDQRSVGSSPRHIAASHVLHRPLMPRHPPCALKHLQSTKPLNKEKSHHNKPPTTPTTPPPKRGTTRRDAISDLMLATTIHESNTTPHHQAGQQQHHPKPIGPTPPHTPTGAHSSRGLVVSKPNSVFSDFLASRHFPTSTACSPCAPDPHPLQA